MPRWTYIRARHGDGVGELLFDRQADPGEHDDRSRDPALTPALMPLRDRLLRRWIDGCRSPRQRLRRF